MRKPEEIKASVLYWIAQCEAYQERGAAISLESVAMKQIEIAGEIAAQLAGLNEKLDTLFDPAKLTEWISKLEKYRDTV